MVNDEDVFVLTPDDYTAMGEPGKNFNFSSSVLAEDYLPAYLAKKVAYPLNDAEKIIVYKYYSGSVKAYSDSYIYSTANARWGKNTYMTTKTEQYVKRVVNGTMILALWSICRMVEIKLIYLYIIRL